MTAEQAIAEAWASLNGELEEFNAGKNRQVPPSFEYGYGYYEGYMSDAKELIKRIEKRGYTITAIVT